MRRTWTFGSLLLLSSALYAPAALAQSTGGQPAPESPPPATTPEAAASEQNTTQPDGQDGEQPIEISAPGGNPTDGDAIVVTGTRIPNVLRRTTEVISVLSQEDIARTGEGDIAGALQRVTGLSVVGNGFVFVRGLGDRYSLALLNGSPLPSPEPLRRVVPLDIFPTSLIASSIVQKTYSVNYPGEFGGGVINLTTRAVPEESFFTVGGSIGGDSITSLNLGYTYYGGDTDWFGYDDGTRRPPAGLLEAAGNFAGDFTATTTAAQRRAFAANLSNASTTVVQRNLDITLNGSGSFTAGTSTDLGGGARLGVIAAGGYSNTWRTRDALQQTTNSATVAAPLSSFQRVITDQRALVNGLLGLGLEVGEHRFRLTNVYIHDTLKQTRLGRGFSEGAPPTTQVPNPLIQQGTYFFERELFDTQFVGELDFGPLDVDLRATFAQTERNSPYERNIGYEYNALAGDYINLLNGSNEFANISFSSLTEKVYGGGIDLIYTPASFPVTFTAGYAYTKTDRNSSRYIFEYRAPNGIPFPVAQERPDYLLSDFNINQFGIELRDVSGGANGAPVYQGNLEVHAGYLQLNATPLDGLTVTGGVRYETGEQSVLAFGRQAFAPTTIRNDYFLPSLTLTYAFAQDAQFRLHGSRTIARPQFRELAPQLYQDFDSDRQFTGNPYLQDSELTNGEARLEWYFARNQRMSFSGFYKKIENPIEPVAFISGGNIRTGFTNIPEAELYGAEAEIQTYIPLESWGGFFTNRRILFIGNYTWTESNVTADGTIVLNPLNVPGAYSAGLSYAQAIAQGVPANTVFRDGGRLSGQSRNLYNAQISLEDTTRLSQLTVLLNYASQRVLDRGIVGQGGFQPDIVEVPGFRVDFVARQEVPFFGARAELQAEVRNIFGVGHIEYQQGSAGRIDVNTYDVGTSFSLGVNLTF